MPPIAAIVLGVAILGGGTVGLSPDDSQTDQPAGSYAEQPADPGTREDPAGVPPAVGLGVIAAALALIQRRDGNLAPSAGLGLRPSDPVFVFVPGHGQPHGSQAFDELIGLMGLADDSVQHFDYRWIEGSPSHTQASEDVRVEDAASALNAYIAGVTSQGRDVYLVGFSKGGSTVAELLADWDDGRWGPTDAVVGAALLDPPIAAGAHGWLQSVGRRIGPVPDDGGYDPVQCRFLTLWCDDRRAHLGEAAGVDVVVIRNPRAAITSFGDVPPGLRVHDAADDGPGPLGQLFRNPFGLPGRVVEAHESVLSDPRVAACLMGEVRRSGTCDLPLRRSTPPLPSLRPPAFSPPTAMKVL